MRTPIISVANPLRQYRLPVWTDENAGFTAKNGRKNEHKKQSYKWLSYRFGLKNSEIPREKRGILLMQFRNCRCWVAVRLNTYCGQGLILALLMLRHK